MNNSLSLSTASFYRGHMTQLIAILIIAISVLTVSVGSSIANAQVSQALQSENSTDDSTENAQESEQPSGPDINFSESIPVDDIIDSWQKRYKSIMSSIGLDDSLNAKLAATALIVLIVLIGRFLSRAASRKLKRSLRAKAIHFRIDQGKVNFYYKMIYGLLSAIVIACGISAIFATWEIDINDWFSEELLISALANALTVYAIVFIGSLTIEIVSGIVERSFYSWKNVSRARIDTLLPIARNTVYIVFICMFVMLLLSELGIDVMPLLAGAGVVGIAIGFGAQTLVKDLITGFIIILEDLVQVGDVVTLSDRTGIIEKITIRKIQLRDLSGVVYTVPYSEISIVENLTKDYSYAMLEIGVAYREDTDHVIDLIRQIDEDLRNDSEFSDLILESLEVFGVDKFADSAVIIKARIKTKPIEQWTIGREFNRRMKYVFDRENIEIPFPHQTIYFGEDKEGNAPPMRLARPNEPASNDEHEKLNVDTDNTKSGAAETDKQPSTSQKSGYTKKTALPDSKSHTEDGGDGD